MGVIYKLLPEIKDFIIEQKKANSALSCRELAVLIEQTFQKKLSKSSINSIIKATGLSMPVGSRRGGKAHRIAMAAQKPDAEVNPVREIKMPCRIVSNGVKLLSAPLPAKPVSVEETVKIQQIDTLAQEECTGSILLKAMDALIGGSRHISEVVRKNFKQEEQGILAKTEALIYLPLFDLSQDTEITVVTRLRSLLGREVFLKDILSYLDYLQSATIKIQYIFAEILGLSRQVRGIKLLLADNKELYLDSQFRTLWPTPYIPYDFSTTIYNIKGYINKYFFQEQPITFFIAPGEDAPLADFFTLISVLNARGNNIEGIVLYGEKFEELQSVVLGKPKRRLFAFGWLPGQFIEQRTIRRTSEFSRFFFEPLGREFYLAETEAYLSQPAMRQMVTLRGCILKTSISEKPPLIILGNNFNEGAPAQLANTYLSHWPNIEEAYQDFSRKVESFSYIGSSEQGFLPSKRLNLGPLSTPQVNPVRDTTSQTTDGCLWQPISNGVKPLFSAYLELLDLYFRQFFLPQEFKDRDFPTIKKDFYDLKTTLKREKNRLSVSFQMPAGISLQGALEYACRRLNEREIEFSDGRRAWFLV